MQSSQTAAPATDATAPLLVADSGGVRTLTLNRPAAFNSFDTALKHALLPAVHEAADDVAVRALVITGAGRAFCAGQDLKEHLADIKAGSPAVADTVSGFYTPLIRAITGMRKPVVAAVNGTAAGAGAALAFACDLRIAAESAKFSMAFAGVALTADSGASYTLPRLIGAGRAAKMLLTGEVVTARRAFEIGMVDEVVPDDEFVVRTAELAEQLAAGPTRAYGWIKASLQHGLTSDLESTLAFEDTGQRDCFSGPDHAEALDAFVAKRTPAFTGR